MTNTEVVRLIDGNEGERRDWKEWRGRHYITRLPINLDVENHLVCLFYQAAEASGAIPVV